MARSNATFQRGVFQQVQTDDPNHKVFSVDPFNTSNIPLFHPEVFQDEDSSGNVVFKHRHHHKATFQTNIFQNAPLAPVATYSSEPHQVFQTAWAVTDGVAPEELISISEPASKLLKIMGRVRIVALRSVGIIEAIHSPRGRYGYASTTMSISEVNSRARTLARDALELISVTHFRGRTRTIARTVAEELISITEQIPPIFRNRMPNIAENIAMIELTASRFMTKSHDTLEKIAMLETNKRFRELSRTLVLELTGISETAKSLRPRIRALSETMIIRLNDYLFQSIFQPNIFHAISGLVRVTGKFRQESKTIGIIETNDRVRTVVRQITNLLGITEANDRVRLLVRTLAEELVSLSETSYRFRSLVRSLTTELMSMAETNNRARTLARSLSTQISITHFRGRTRSVARSISELIGMTEVNSTLRARIRQLTELSSLTEILVRARIMSRSLSESAALIEISGRARSISRSIAIELMGMTEIQNTLRRRIRSIVEVSSITESIVRVFTRVRTVIETIGVSETNNRMKLVIRALAELSGIIEIKYRLRTRVMSILNSVALIEVQPSKVQGFVRILSTEIITITHFSGESVKEAFVRIRKIAKLFGRGRTVKTYKRGRSVKGADR